MHVLTAVDVQCMAARTELALCIHGSQGHLTVCEALLLFVGLATRKGLPLPHDTRAILSAQQFWIC